VTRTRNHPPLGGVLLDVTVVQRYSRTARWFHAVVYLLVLILLATGWWYVVDRYQHQIGPAGLHEISGIVLVVVVVLYAMARARAVREFLRESVSRESGDGRWLKAWPQATFTGRFPHHDGRYDPGQRLANLVPLTTLAVICLSGLAMRFLPDNGQSLKALEIHRWATFAVTPVILGHIVIAAGVLPGYRGVWRSMHLGGRLPDQVAHRIWPGWTDRNTR
jgi:cytochrome b subunit of formate dehydrogenase